MGTVGNSLPEVNSQFLIAGNRLPTTGYVTTPRPEQIGAWLKQERVRDGRFSQEQVAPLVGSTTRTVGAWERGETMPDADQLFFLCGLYGVRAIDLKAIAQMAVPVRRVAEAEPPVDRAELLRQVNERVERDPSEQAKGKGPKARGA